MYVVNKGVYVSGKRYADIVELAVTPIKMKRQRTRLVKHGYDYPKTVFIKEVNGPLKYEFEVGSELPVGLYTTKLQALKYAVKDVEESVQWYKDEMETDDVKNDPEDLAIYVEELENMKVILRMVKGKITKLKKTGK